MQQNYIELTESELEEKIRTAREWLKDNENHPKYIEGLKRYVEIVGILRKKRAVKSVPRTRKGFNLLKGTKVFKKWFSSQFMTLKGICPECEERMGMRTKEGRYATTDHIVELVNGGTNDYSNFRVICNLCNNKKDHERMTGGYAGRYWGVTRIPKSYETDEESIFMRVYRYLF